MNKRVPVEMVCIEKQVDFFLDFSIFLFPQVS